MANYVIGIDLGGTNTVIGLVDVNGKILAKDDSVKTQKYKELEDYVDVVSAVIKKLAVENSVSLDDIDGIGIGAPMGNYYSGDIENAANLPWKGRVPLGRMLTEKSGLPTKVTNDANAAAIGEMKYGAAKGMRDFIVITLGTGVRRADVVYAEGEPLTSWDVKVNPDDVYVRLTVYNEYGKRAWTRAYFTDEIFG